MACTCNLANLLAGLENGVGSIPVWGNSSSIGRWIVRTMVNQDMQGSTITIKSLYMIAYVGLNFGIRDVCGQIPKSI